MQEKIKEMLPKEKEESSAFIGNMEYPNWTAIGYNKCLQDVHAKIPEIVEYVLKKERNRIDSEITKQFKYAYKLNNYDLRGVAWKELIYNEPALQETLQVGDKEK